MPDEFVERKIRELTDEDLRDLLKIRHLANPEVMSLAIEEAGRRRMEFPELEEPSVRSPEQDARMLEKWNWGAFFLAPYWAFANGLDLWAVIALIPGLNILAVIYLGWNGNKIAYGKSLLKNVDEFMVIQNLWSKWGMRFLSVYLAIALWDLLDGRSEVIDLIRMVWVR